MDTNQKRKFPVFVFFAIVLIAAASAVFYFSKDADLPPDSSTQDAVNEETSVDEEFGYGVVTGSLSYPSDHIPPEMKICAESLDGDSVLCTNEHVEGTSFLYGMGYSLTLPEGEYYIYAYVPTQIDAEGDIYRAYYSEFVTCGLSVDCSSHEPIIVEVVAGETVSSVDPHDWYQ